MLVCVPRPGTAACDKEAWRRTAREARAGLDVRTWSRVIVDTLRAWTPYVEATTVALYLGVGSEADLSTLHDDDKRFAAPRTHGRGRPMTMHLLGGPLDRRSIGLLEPRASAPLVEPADVDVVLVPGLAFTRRGVRLGYGGGHYDRWLANLPDGVPSVGITHDRLLADELPSEAHDVRVTHLALTTGVEACR